MKKLLFRFFWVLFLLPTMEVGAAPYNLQGKITFPDSKKPDAAFHVTWSNSGGTKGGFITNDKGEYDQAPAITGETELTLSYVGCAPVTVKAKELKATSNYTFICTPEEIDIAVVTEYSVNGSAGCDNEDNEFIAPDLALCSTHAYNGGWDENPTNESTRAQMREIIALKTTFMTQQMNKQYEYLESMIRRFKIQLEKAVLLTRLEKAGASTESSSGGDSSASAFKSTDRNVHMADVENCNTKLLPTDVLQCLSTNLTTISNVTGNGSEVSREARKQMVNDVKVLKGTYSSIECKGLFGSDQKRGKCENENSIKKKDEFQNCMDEMRACIRDKMYKLNLEEQQSKRNN